MKVKPVSDLKNNFADDKNSVESPNPIPLQPKTYLVPTTRAILDRRPQACESLEHALDAADHQAEKVSSYYTHDEVFGSVREMLRRAQEATAE